MYLHIGSPRRVGVGCWLCQAVSGSERLPPHPTHKHTGNGSVNRLGHPPGNRCGRCHKPTPTCFPTLSCSLALSLSRWLSAGHALAPAGSGCSSPRAPGCGCPPAHKEFPPAPARVPASKGRSPAAAPTPSPAAAVETKPLTRTLVLHGTHPPHTRTRGDSHRRPHGHTHSHRRSCRHTRTSRCSNSQTHPL